MFIDHLNHHYLTTKTKLNNKEVKWIKKLATFNFTIIYCKKAKNLTDNLSRRPDFKNNNELSTTKHQPLSNFLSKFQEHLEGTKNDPTKEQNIDFNKTPLPRNVLNLIEAPQDTNSIRILSIKSESKSDSTEE